MGQVTDALAEGFAVLLATAGEPLTFRGASVTAVVNRSPRSTPIPNAVNFKPHDASEISHWADDTDPIPKAGERYTDAAGLQHRVQSVQRLGDRISCTCHVSDPSS